MAKRGSGGRADTVQAPYEGRATGRAARDAAKATRASAQATAAAARALERELEPPPASAVDPYMPDWSGLDEEEFQEIQDWGDALGQYDSGSGVRISVWKQQGQGGVGKRSWIGWLEDPHDPDVLGRIREMAQQAGVAGGEQTFSLQPVSRRTNRFIPELGARQVTLSIPPAPAAPPTSAAVDPLMGARTIVETAQALNPKATSADPLDIVAKTLGMVKDLRPGEAVSDKVLALLPTVLPALKDLFAPKPSAMERAMTEFYVQRLAGQGGERGDLVDEVEKIRAIVDVLKPFVGGGEGEPRTAGVALIETLPEVVKHLAAPIDKFADAYRWRMMRGAAPPTAPAPPALPPAVQALWRDLAAAAARMDDGYFPVLANRLRDLIPGAEEFLTGLAAGHIPHEQGLATFQQLGGEIVPPTRAYLVRFFNWLQWSRPTARPAAPPGPGPTITTAVPAPPGNGTPAGAVVGRCDRCGAEYDYGSEAAWATEHADPCGDCGGTVRRVLEATA